MVDETKVRKYTVDEIDQMRRAIERSYPTGVSYRAVERSNEVEDRLRTYMQNGTDPAELQEMANKRFEDEFRAHERHQKYLSEVLKNAPPPPPPPKTAAEVIERWYASSVAHYDGASDTLDDLYDGFTGQTLKRYANQHAPDGVNISKRDLEKFLDGKGIRHRHAMWKKRYDGICHVLYGNVSSGNYGT